MIASAYPRVSSAGHSARLPLGRPASSSYLFFAYPLAILAARGVDSSWLHSHFLRLYHALGRGLKVYTHPNCTSTQMSQVYDAGYPRLMQRVVDPGQIITDPLDTLRQYLSQGIYPQVDVDFMQLGLEAYESAFLHEVLLCGFGMGCFELFAFDRSGRLSRQWVEARRLRAAMNVSGPHLLKERTSCGERVPAWLIADWRERPLWILHQPAADDSAQVSRGTQVTRVLEGLTAYLTDQPPEDLPPGRLPGKTHWGHSAQLDWVDSLRQSDSQWSAICLRLWCEHKQIMAQRLHWLTQSMSGSAQAQQLAQQLAQQMTQLASRAQGLRLAALRQERHPTIQRRGPQVVGGGHVEDQSLPGGRMVRRRLASQRLLHRRQALAGQLFEVAMEEKQLLLTLLEQRQ